MTTIVIITGIVSVLIIGTFLFLRQPSFGRLPQGERMERIRRSPNYKDGEFKNLQPTQLMTGSKSRWQTLWEFLFADRSRLEPDKPIKAVKTDLKHLPTDENLMIWFGHSSYLLQIDGKRILADPVFHTASPVSFLYKPFAGTDIYKPEDMPEVIDYLVISHDHWDHLDYQTVVALKDRVRKVVCPLGVGEHFERWGYRKEQLIELDWMEDARLDKGFTVHCLPARHFSGRGLKSNQSLWASFLLDTPSLRIFMGGDSGYGTHFHRIAERHPGIDWAILENGQYNEDWRYIHTLPRQLKQVAKDLKAKNVVTVHHSKFALARHPWNEPLQNEKRLQADTTLHVATPFIGEKLRLSKQIYRYDTDTFPLLMRQSVIPSVPKCHFEDVKVPLRPSRSGTSAKQG